MFGNLIQALSHCIRIVSVLLGFDFRSVRQVLYLSDCSVFHHCLGLMAKKKLDL